MQVFIKTRYDESTRHHYSRVIMSAGSAGNLYIRIVTFLFMVGHKKYSRRKGGLFLPRCG